MDSFVVEKVYAIVQRLSREWCYRARKRGRCSLEADDLCQTVMLRLLNTQLLKSYDPTKAPLEAYLYVIVRSTAQNSLRGERRRVERDTLGTETLYRRAIRVKAVMNREHERRQLDGLAVSSHEQRLIEERTAHQICEVVARQLTPETARVFALLRAGAERQQVREIVGWRTVRRAYAEIDAALAAAPVQLDAGIYQRAAR